MLSKSCAWLAARSGRSELKECSELPLLTGSVSSSGLTAADSSARALSVVPSVLFLPGAGRSLVSCTMDVSSASRVLCLVKSGLAASNRFAKLLRSDLLGKGVSRQRPMVMSKA